MTVALDILIGRTLDEKYRIEERLGKGGMGEVYRATHLRLEQPVAVKVMNPRLLDKPEARQRFLQEARTTGRVQHPNAVSVSDYGETRDGLVYLVMEFLEGASLRQIISSEAPLDPARAVSLMLQVAAAVGAAHEAGVLHRDLKPPNIFLEQRKDTPSSVRLLDFGIAKLLKDAETDEDSLLYITGGGTLLGTPRYMSPEQCDGETLTPASDVYSLGVILYEMLTGETPFSGNAIDLILQHALEAPRPLREINPSIPQPLEFVTLHALAKNPFVRPPDAAAFRRELLATAERLGLEQAHTDLLPALEKLKGERFRSQSGRYVIDLEKLREQRAVEATLAAAPLVSEVTVEEKRADDSPAPASEPLFLSGLTAYSAPPSAIWNRVLLAGVVTCALLALCAGAFVWLRPAAIKSDETMPNAVSTPANSGVRGGATEAPTPAEIIPQNAPAQVGQEPLRDNKTQANKEVETKREKPVQPLKNSRKAPVAVAPRPTTTQNKKVVKTTPAASVPKAGSGSLLSPGMAEAEGASRPRRVRRPN